MHITRCLRPRARSAALLRPVSTSARRLEAVTRPATQPLVQDEKFDFEDLKVSERALRRKPPIAPFIKDCFLSLFNRELLEYPEILNREESEALDARADTLEKILQSPEMSKQEKEDAIKNTKIFGAPAPLTLGGLALIATERVRYLETLSADLDIAKAVSDHWVSLDTLKLGLPPAEYDKIVPDLLTGEKRVALCTKEAISTRVAQPDLRATASLSGGGWSLWGEKICRDSGDYMLTMCTYEQFRLRAFLVSPGADGVERDGPFVRFQDTPATALTEVTEAQLSNVLSISRLDTAVLAYSLLRRMTLGIMEYVRGKFVSGQPLADLPLIRTKVADALLTVYTAESMVYFTAGLLDGYENPDAELEMVLCRTFIVEHGLDSVMGLLSILGMDGMSDEFAHFLQQFRRLQVKDEHNDSLNLYAALTGLHHAGKNMAVEVKQMRNPLFHPSYIIKKMFANRDQEKDDPKLTLYLEENLHPSMQQSAQCLEYAVLRLRYASELLLARHGADVYKQHMDLERLAKAAAEILAMTSVLARASRSYCIGLRGSEEEMRLAATAADASKQRAQLLIKRLDDGEFLNADHVRTSLGRKVLDSGTLLVERPTARVWW